MVTVSGDKELLVMMSQRQEETDWRLRRYLWFLTIILAFTAGQSGVLIFKINIIPVSLAILFFSYVNQRSRYLSGDVDTITIRTGTWFDNNVPEEELNDRPIIGNMSRHEK